MFDLSAKATFSYLEVLNQLKTLIQINMCIFDSRSEFSLTEGSVGKNVIILEVDMSSSVHIDNKKKKNILIFGIGLTQRLHDITWTAGAEYSINFSRSNRKFCV